MQYLPVQFQKHRNEQRLPQLVTALQHQTHTTCPSKKLNLHSEKKALFNIQNLLFNIKYV